MGHARITAIGKLAPSRLGPSIVRRWRGHTRDPFRPDGGRPVIVHCGHHKQGWTWMARVLRELARTYGLRYTDQQDVTAIQRADVAVVRVRDFRRGDFSRPPRISHLVRDPRDVAVSGYHYHQWTTEEWANTPLPRLGGRTYRQALSTLDHDRGLLFEMRGSCSTTLAELLQWDYDQADVLELRYEDLLADQQRQFERLFRWYGLNDEAVDRGLAIAERFSFRGVTGREIGQVQAGDHLRSGLPGQWRQEFGPDHVAWMKEAAGDLLVRLGYEQSGNWDIDR